MSPPVLRQRFAASLAATLVAVAACSDGPVDPVGGAASFSVIQEGLVADCGTCHGAGSGRFFQTTMDSAALHQSGLVDPANPNQSLLYLKPTNSTPHGGGLIESFSAEDWSRVAQWIAALPPLTGNRLEAIRVGPGTTIAAPVVDGFFDAVWGQVPAAVYRVTGGWGQAEFVKVTAAYDDTYLYMLIVWDDDRPSFRRQPWIKLSDGSWAVVPAKNPLPAPGSSWAAYMGAAGFDEEDAARFSYEDKLAVIWNTYGASTVAGFDQSGCAVLCHDPSQGGLPGTTYDYAAQQNASKKYTNAPSEIADMWHWKLVRNNQHGKLDDQYVRFWVPGAAGAANGGRASDAGDPGYGNNPALNGRPQFRGPGTAVPPYYLYDNQKVELTDAEAAALPVGREIPNMITSGPTGPRADVDAKGLWNQGRWKLEIRRKLVTGDPNDVQFDVLSREYAFGVAVFDNAQIEHRYTPVVAKLVFRP